MPIYSFRCEICGDFTEMRGMRLADAAATCPLCGVGAQRIFAVPYVARMNPAVRRAHERNEKSAHEPRVVSAQDWRRAGPRIRTGHTCAHGHGHLKRH